MVCVGVERWDGCCCLAGSFGRLGLVTLSKLAWGGLASTGGDKGVPWATDFVCVCLFLSTWLHEHLHKGCSSPFPISASCSFSCGLYLGHHTIPSNVTGDVRGLGSSVLLLLLPFFACGSPAPWGWAATPPVSTVTTFPYGWGHCPVLPAVRT